MRTENESSAVVFLAAGGINQRVSPPLLKETEFSDLRGIIPLRIGAQARMPGKELIKQFDSTVLAIHQTFDSRDNIIIQTETDVHIYSLSELLDREYTPVTP